MIVAQQIGQTRRLVDHVRGRCREIIPVVLAQEVAMLPHMVRFDESHMVQRNAYILLSKVVRRCVCNPFGLVTNDCIVSSRIARVDETWGICTRRAGKLYKARSRLYRSQILQVNMRWKALAEIYTMHSFAPVSNLKIFVKNC